MQGVDQHGPYTCDVCGLFRTQNRVPQQCAAHTLPLDRRIHGKAGQQHDRNGIRHIATNFARHEHMADAPHRQRVITDYIISTRDYIGAAGPTGFIFTRASLQPIIKNHLAATERLQIVLLFQMARRGYFHAISPKVQAYSASERERDQAVRVRPALA